MRKTMPVARRVLGEGDTLTLRMNWTCARALCLETGAALDNIRTGAALDNIREAVTTLEPAERIARRVLGGAHPLTRGIEDGLRDMQAALRAASSLAN